MPNARVALESDSVDVIPVPDSCTIWGLNGALSVTVNAPVAAPVAVGVNTTLIAQFVPGWRATRQLFVSENAPLAVILEMVIGVVPEFIAVIAIGALATPTVSEVMKASGEGESTRVEFTPVPVS